jgi:LmbE family N-acetylglucosaminyl deacetylase
MPLLYPELEAEGLTAHKVNNVFIRSRQEGDFLIDTSRVMEVKLEALKQHKSQFTGWDPAEPVKVWDAETGKKVGFKYAESYKRILLHDPLSKD